MEYQPKCLIPRRRKIEMGTVEKWLGVKVNTHCVKITFMHRFVGNVCLELMLSYIFVKRSISCYRVTY